MGKGEKNEDGGGLKETGRKMKRTEYGMGQYPRPSGTTKMIRSKKRCSGYSHIQLLSFLLDDALYHIF